MSNLMAQVSETLLKPNAIDPHHLQQVLETMMNGGVNYADIYFQSSCDESWSLEEGIVKQGSFSIEQGVGVRAVAGEKSGLAYANTLDMSEIKKAAVLASSIADSGNSGRLAVSKLTQCPVRYQPVDPLLSLSDQDKIAMLHDADMLARQLDSRVKEVSVSLSGQQEFILIANSEGELVADVRPLIRFHINVITEQNGRRESGSSGGGRRATYDYFTLDNFYHRYVKEAVRLALLNLESVAAPAGEMPVVLGPGWPGVLLHEAIGHGLEGDFNRKGSSAFSGKIGQQVASSLCTVVDDGTLADRRGSLTVDDEGTPTECTVLIEKGILKAYMTDRLNADLLKMPRTGNGRREAYNALPIPRMTNTYMRPGQDEPADIIASVKKGIYAVNFGGGQVDITSGNFVFSTSEAYLIEDGKITSPLKDCTLIGAGPEILKRVSMVGHDLSLDEGVGTCGKEGQSVPVGVGQPTLKIDKMTVGGTA